MHSKYEICSIIFVAATGYHHQTKNIVKKSCQKVVKKLSKVVKKLLKISSHLEKKMNGPENKKKKKKIIGIP
jgi:DNA-binding transcriptional regulator GbsR (MarR family)